MGPYCYKVEAYNEVGSSESTEICKRVREVNEPLDADAVDATPTTLTIVWQDTSQIEWGFEISYRVVNGPPDNRTVVAIPFGEYRAIRPFRTCAGHRILRARLGRLPLQEI